MSPTYRLPFSKYASGVRGLLYTHLLPIVKFTPAVNNFDLLNALGIEVAITFKDGDTFSGIETLKNTRDGIEVVRYGFKYQRVSGFFVQYEMEGLPREDDDHTTGDSIRKPLHHMHVGADKDLFSMVAEFPPELIEHDGLHYRTHPVSLEYVLAIIIVNFYPEALSILDELSLNEFLS
jgi:hypothetical protein